VILQNNKLIKSLALMFSSSIFAMGISLLITYSLAKLLAPSKLGILMTAEAFVDLFRFFFYFGFNNTILKFASEHKEGFEKGLNKAVGNAFLIKAVITIPLFIAIFLISKFSIKDIALQEIIQIYAWVFILESFSSLFGIARRALGQFKLISGIVILNKVLRLVTILIVLNYTKDIKILVLFFLLEKIIRLFISWITTKKFIKLELDLPNIKTMIKDCFGYAFVDPLQGVQNKIDRVMINSFIGPAAVAFYTIPAKITTAIQTLIKTGSSTLAPNLHGSLRKDEANYVKSINHIFRFSNISAVLSFYFIYFYAQKILTFLFGDKYSASYTIVYLFSYLSMISILENTPEIIFTTKASHKIRIFYKVLSMLVNVGLNIVLLTKYGIKGAIFATIIANSVRLIIKYWLARDEFKFTSLVFNCFIPILVMHFLNPYLSLIGYIIFIVISKQITLDDLKRIKKLVSKDKGKKNG
jgi:O-antigen/teichoic acid export membrane protein